VSVWADEIRGTATDEPRWHYDDAPVCDNASRDQYCPGGQCNSAQLERLTRVLAEPQAPLRARNEALKWVVHLVGDIHQPLHAADNGDRGGNDVRVALAGVHTRGRWCSLRGRGRLPSGRASPIDWRRTSPTGIPALCVGARPIGSWCSIATTSARRATSCANGCWWRVAGSRIYLTKFS
jgi:hypothetical protein